LTLAVLAEEGIPVEGLASQAVADFAGKTFDLAVTVCDSARQECAVFPGALRTVHWPFPDPVIHAVSEQDSAVSLEIFRTALNAIRKRIQRYLITVDFENRLHLIIDQLPGEIPSMRLSAYRELVSRCSLALDEQDPWAELPAIIADLMGAFGWGWNGIYLLKGNGAQRSLELLHAAGPPVCTTIEETPDSENNGMCFDAVNQGSILVASDVKKWPGYISCDEESGLETCSGMARPILDEAGDVVAVWDVDSTEPLNPADGLLLDALIEGFGANGTPRRMK
jgi:putative methionine-R-sulfoxide reductase with GAF domain